MTNKNARYPTLIRVSILTMVMLSLSSCDPRRVLGPDAGVVQKGDLVQHPGCYVGPADVTGPALTLDNDFQFSGTGDPASVETVRQRLFAQYNGKINIAAKTVATVGVGTKERVTLRVLFARTEATGADQVGMHVVSYTISYRVSGEWSLESRQTVQTCDGGGGIDPGGGIN